MVSVDHFTENDVIEAVCRYLELNGYKIDQRLNTKQRGDDIIAVKGDIKLYIEAKGATSSRTGSKRYGQPFDSAQVRVHVAEAVYKSIQVLSRSKTSIKVRAGIALPANQLHEREIITVEKVVRKLGILIFWVKSIDDVREVSYFQ